MIKTKLGYFLPVTSPAGLKELRWQQTPFAEQLSHENENQNVSCETLEQLDKYLIVMVGIKIYFRIERYFVCP